jgi:hypothetical protein
MEMETLLLLKPLVVLVLQASFREFPQAVPALLLESISLKRVVLAYVLQVNQVVGMEPMTQIAWVLVSVLDPIIKHLKNHGSNSSLTMDGVPRQMLEGFIPVLASYFIEFQAWLPTPSGNNGVEEIEMGVDPRMQAAAHFTRQLEEQLEALDYPATDPFVVDSHAQLARLRERMRVLANQQPPPQVQLVRQEE